MKLPFLDTTEGDAFARELTVEFARVFAAGADASSGPGARGLSRGIEVLGNRVAKFNREKRLGWYRRSRFMNAIKDSLLEMGYPAELVDRVVYAAALRLLR